MLNAAGGNLSIRYGLRGPNYTVATACASATNAMGDAMKTIQYDDADIVVTGVRKPRLRQWPERVSKHESSLGPQRCPAPGQSTIRRRPRWLRAQRRRRYPDFRRAGTCQSSRARIYAEVLGYGASGDAGHITQPDPEGSGAARAMQNALRDAKLPVETMDYINAHGTSTPLGDKAETQAMKAVYGQHAHSLSISSTKGHLGHALGASGGIEMILTALAVYNDIVPPTINLVDPDPNCDLNYTPNVPVRRTITTAMNNSFGFGGHNASIICAKYEQHKSNLVDGQLIWFDQYRSTATDEQVLAVGRGYNLVGCERFQFRGPFVGVLFTQRQQEQSRLLTMHLRRCAPDRSRVLHGEDDLVLVRIMLQYILQAPACRRDGCLLTRIVSAICKPYQSTQQAILASAVTRCQVRAIGSEGTICLMGVLAACCIAPTGHSGNRLALGTIALVVSLAKPRATRHDSNNRAS